MKIAKKLVCFGAHGVNVFQGCRAGANAHWIKHNASYLVAMHYCAHRTSLVAKCLSHLVVVNKVEKLCKVLYTYFHKTPKRFSKFQQ